MDKTLRIAVIEPLKAPYIKVIPFDMDAISEIIGGYAETVPYGKENILLLCNEDGLRLELPPNRVIFDEYGFPIHKIHGTFIACRYGDYDIDSLNDKQEKEVLTGYLSSPMSFAN